jgi:hypothetical protein
LRGITPELDLVGLADAQKARLKPILINALGVHDTLPEDWPSWRSWCKALADTVDAGREVKERVVRDFYETLLARKFAQPTIPPPERLVCVAAESPFGLRAVPAAEATWIDKPMLASSDLLDALVRAGLAYLPALLDRGEGAPARLGLRRASDVVKIEPTVSQRSEAETLRLGRRLSERWRAILVQCEAKGARAPQRPNIQAVHGLTLALSVDGTFAANVVTSAFQDGDLWLINLDGSEFEGLAAALADGLGHGTDLRYRFAAVLRAKTARDVRRVLIEDRIPLYRLDTAGIADDEPEAPDPPQEDPETASTGRDEDWPSTSSSMLPPPAAPVTPGSSAPSAQNSPTGSVYGTGRLKERPLYDADGKGGGNGGWGGASTLGLEGEQWLEHHMRATLPPGAELVMHVRDAQHRESDLVLTLSGRSLHIEVKSLSSQRFYWSGHEIAKAQQLTDAYWMCFLVREGWGFKVHWSWSPLKDLLVCERRMQWQWAFESEGPLLAKDSWKPIDGTKTPERAPDRATAVIRILEEHLATLTRDGPALEGFWHRVGI